MMALSAGCQHHHLVLRVSTMCVTTGHRQVWVPGWALCLQRQLVYRLVRVRAPLLLHRRACVVSCGLVVSAASQLLLQCNHPLTCTHSHPRCATHSSTSPESLSVSVFCFSLPLCLFAHTFAQQQPQEQLL